MKTKKKKKTKVIKCLKKKKKLAPLKKKAVVTQKKELSLKKSSFLPEDKIEIKKIKKQATEKRQYNIKDFVVYPKHGVGKITAIEKATIGQIDIQFYKIFVENSYCLYLCEISRNLQSNR